MFLTIRFFRRGVATGTRRFEKREFSGAGAQGFDVFQNGDFLGGQKEKPRLTGARDESDFPHDERRAACFAMKTI